MTYSDKLRDPRWQKIRLEVFERDGFACCSCGDTETTLHVHHTEYFGHNPWDTPIDKLKTMCENCHELQHMALTPLERVLVKKLFWCIEGNKKYTDHVHYLIRKHRQNG